MSKIKGAPAVPFMPEFKPLASLWTGPGAPYPSEFSARWAVRKHREELARAQAMAVHRSRLMVHPVRFAQVLEQANIAAFVQRVGGDAVPGASIP